MRNASLPNTARVSSTLTNVSNYYGNNQVWPNFMNNVASIFDNYNICQNNLDTQRMHNGTNSLLMRSAYQMNSGPSISNDFNNQQTGVNKQFPMQYNMFNRQMECNPRTTALPQPLLQQDWHQNYSNPSSWNVSRPQIKFSQDVGVNHSSVFQFNGNNSAPQRPFPNSSEVNNNSGR